MRTETEMMNLILQMAESLKVDAVALSGSRTNDHAPKMNFKTMMLFILLIILKPNFRPFLARPVWETNY